MALDLTHGRQFHMVVLTDAQGISKPVRIVADNERFIFMSGVNSMAHRTGIVASLRPIVLSGFEGDIDDATIGGDA